MYLIQVKNMPVIQTKNMPVKYLNIFKDWGLFFIIELVYTFCI